MIKNLTLLFIGVVLLSVNGISQQDYFDCPTSEDNALCDLDDINGYTFSNDGVGDLPTDALCGGGAFHNPGWFSFVAGSTEIILTVTPLAGTCDTVPNGNTGVQVALWEGCPGQGGECVAGDANCYDTPVVLEAMDLTIGEVYNLVIDGCSGSICTVEVTIDNADAFQLPDLTDVEFADPEYNLGRGGDCDNSLGDGNFCAGLEVLFQVDDDFYETLGAEYYWTITGPDADQVEWSFGSFSGTGNPVEIGDLDGELGANGVNMIFPTNGTYTICLDNVVTECDADAEGPLCIEVNIISPGDQEFGHFDVCALDLLAGWEPEEENAEGNPWIAGPIFYDDVIDNDGHIEIMTEDDCGCDFTQIIDITARGSIDRVDVELYVWECMFEYEWFGEEFVDAESLPEGEPFDLVEGSAEENWEGTNCDSLLNLTITVLTSLDTVIVGDCTSDGTEFTFVFTALDPQGNDVEVEIPSFEWIDANTGMVVANTQTALLETGSYFVNFESFITDLNYVEPELAGLEELHECNFLFGPYDLVGGSSTSPNINPYDQVFCGDDLDLLTFTIDTMPDTDYNWIIPPSYTVLYSAEDSLAVSIPAYVETDTLFVTAANSCGASDSIPLPIMVVDGPTALTNGPMDVCDGTEYFTGYDGDPLLIQAYLWDVPGGMITTGDAMSQNIGITYPSSGVYSYTLTVTDLDGCTSSESFDVTVEDVIAAPVVDCDGDPSQIIFMWDDVVGASGYVITEVDLPAGATGEEIGNTYVITGINGGDEATIIVTAEADTDCITTGEEVTCEAPGCDFSGIVNNNFNDFAICFGDTTNMPVQFDITLPGNYTGSYTGNGLSSTGLFDPDSPDLVFGDNMLNFDYVDATGCNGTISAIVTVNQLPNASFTPSSTDLCVGEVIQLTGAAAAGVYDYGSGSVGDLNALSYTTSGEKTISVTVIDPNSGCRDDYEVNVMVSDTLPAPLIDCTPGTTSVDFDWDDHVLADMYEITVVVNGGAPEVINQSNSDYTRPGLTEGDVVEITVTATASNGCNTVSVTESCEAKACLIPDISLSATEMVFCNNEPLNTVEITAIVDGAVPADGTYEYIGNGVSTDMGITTFDPSMVTPGITRITFRYTNPVDDCVTSATIDFEVIDVPTPEFTLDPSNICIDQTLSLTLESRPPSVMVDIRTDADFQNQISPDVVELGWDMPGSFDVQVAYTLASCPEVAVEQNVVIQDTIRTPNISCTDVDTDFIQFGWQDQTDVTEYEVYINNTLVSTQANSDYLLDMLDPGEQAEIRVVAIDPVCGNKESTEICNAQDCIPPTWDLDVPDELCYEAGSGPITLDVSAMSNAMAVGTLSFLNPEVDDDGNFSPGDISQDYMITAVFTEKNCVSDTTFSIRVNVIPSAELELISDNVICVGSSVMVQSNYVQTANELPMWDFDGGQESGTDFGPYEVVFDTPGTYNISLSIDNGGCASSEEMVEIIVEEELLAPEVMCSSSDINEIDISWDAIDCAGEYRILVDNMEYEITSNTQTTITGLTENQQVDIIVEAISECACSNVLSQTFSCASKECIEPTWDINVPSELCYELGSGSIALDVVASSNEPMGSGTLSWSNPEVDANNNFTPNANSQDYSLTVTYTEGECSFDQTIDIRVNIIPVAQLELTSDNVICEGESVMVRSNYQVTGNEQPMWDFDGGQDNGSGFGPYEVRFDTPGNYTISLVVDNEGCPSDSESVQIEVQAELEPPVVDCSSVDINSIDLSWDAVDCASGYRIIVDGSEDGQTNNTSYTITGLNENQEVDVIIEAISECACDNVLSQTVQCSSKPCDQTTWTFSNNTLDAVCLDANAQAFTISATPDDLPGNGTGSWSGAPISNPNGTVDPSLVSAGTYDLIYSYEEAGCMYTAPVLQITFVEEPDLQLTAMDPACPMDLEGTISAEGFGGEPGYSYSLDGSAFQSSGEFSAVSIGSHQVEIIDANGCVNTAQIDLFAPLNPIVEISGPITVISENDATYTVDIQNAENIEDIIWTSNGQIVCQGINCLSYTAVNAIGDFELAVEVIYNGGCMGMSELFSVDVKEIQAFYVPNIVTIGGTPGRNSEWKIFIKGNETFPRSIKVYDRWGNLIHDGQFAITQPTAEVLLWDGYSGDNQVSTGVYVYALEIEIEGRTEFVVGDITILR